MAINWTLIFQFAGNFMQILLTYHHKFTPPCPTGDRIQLGIASALARHYNLHHTKWYPSTISRRFATPLELEKKKKKKRKSPLVGQTLSTTSRKILRPRRKNLDRRLGRLSGRGTKTIQGSLDLPCSQSFRNRSRGLVAAFLCHGILLLRARRNDIS